MDENKIGNLEGIQGKPRKINMIESIQKGALAVYKTFIRFPLAILFFIVIASIIIYLNGTSYVEWVQKILSRVMAVLWLGIFFTLAVDVFIERYWSKANIFIRLASYIIQLALLTAYFFLLFPDTGYVSGVRLGLFAFALGLAFLFIQYMNGKENYEIFITKIIARIVTTGFFMLVLMWGLIAVVFAVKSLLYKDLSNDFFLYSRLFAMCVFAPVYFLSGFPKKEDHFDIGDYNSIQKMVLMYIITPIISIYTVVLYIYFAKILILQAWPKGMVSYLVVSYTFIGLVSIFLLTPYFNKNKWVDIFSNLYLKLVIPLLGMMFVSIGIRVGQFGFTENRYFILIIGLWATFAVIFMNLYKGRRNVMLPISLAIVAFLTVIGPWSAFNVSVISQNNRLGTLLSKNGMITNGEVTPGKKEVSKSDKEQITSILRYFERQHSFAEVSYLPKGFTLKKMKDVFGFEPVTEYIPPEKTGHFSYYRPENMITEVKDYDIMVPFYYYNYGYRDEKRPENSYESSYGNIKINVNDKSEVIILKDDKELFKYNLMQDIIALSDKYGMDVKKMQVKDELLYKGENNNVKVKILYKSIEADIDEKDNNKIKINNLQADIMLKFK